jgi:uncharacterized paraquat-inducible protein A
MSTDTPSDTDTEPTFQPRESETETDDHDAWKIHCRECSELVPAKPYCYECGAEHPADGDFYVGEEVVSR